MIFLQNLQNNVAFTILCIPLNQRSPVEMFDRPKTRVSIGNESRSIDAFHYTRFIAFCFNRPFLFLRRAIRFYEFSECQNYPSISSQTGQRELSHKGLMDSRKPVCHRFLCASQKSPATFRQATYYVTRLEVALIMSLSRNVERHRLERNVEKRQIFAK